MEGTLSLDKTLTSILFIAYQFPPRGGPGVHRSANFVRNLSDFGFNPIVLTVKEEAYKKAGEQMDESLLATIPRQVRIVRTSGCQPVNFINLMNRLRIFRIFWYLFYPFFWERMALWPFRVYQIAKREIQLRQIPIVYTSSGPFSSMLLGKMLKKRLGIQWVADLRDPFTDAYAWHFPSKLHWLIARKMEKKILQKADILIVNTPEVKKLFLKRGIGNEDTIRVITNGY